ncbi:MAG: MaoC family dehydratase [Halodesulfurarchaeum sp.]
MYRYARPDQDDLALVRSEATKHFTESLLEAQRGALATFGLIEDVEIEDTRGTAYASPGWEFERSVEHPENISVGDTVEFTKAFDEEEVKLFASVSGDTNRLHLDEAFAEDTRFGGRIVHGTLVAGLISSALARLPGLTIYLSQDLTFVAPVPIGERLTAQTEVLEDLGDGKYRLKTDVVRAESKEEVIKGEAVVLVDDLPPGTGYAAENDD